MNEIKTTCCYCGVGCGVLVASDGQQITGVRGDPAHPANFGRLCSKGSTLHLSTQALLQAQTRVRYPELRNARIQPRLRVSWDQALSHVAQRFATIITEHGPDSVAFYLSGQLLTEDYYVFNKLVKGLIGTNNIDTNSRLCMSSAVAGYKQSLGADAPPACYDDIEQAEVIFIVGSNTAYAHPIVYRRLEAARQANPNLKVIVADPRRTDTAKEADLFLPILPGTDVALFNGMLHILLWEDLIDLDYIASHTEGFAELKQRVREYHPAMVAKTCGIAEADLMQAARWFGQSKATLSLYCQGLNQSAHGTAKNTALINLHLATGQIGKVGAGPFSLTGQPNAMGGREVGGLSNLLSAHRDMANPAHRAEVAQLWGVPDVPFVPGKSAVELFEAMRKGEIKAVWIACTNPAQSMPDQNAVRAALEMAELVVVQEAYHTSATVQYADVLLPATTWGEKEGTVTNSERRISRCLPVLDKPFETRHDWQIAIDFAHKLAPLLGKSDHLFPYQTTEQIWNEHRQSTIGRDLDIGGLSYAILEQQGPQQWPYPQGARTGRARLYEDGVFPTASGRARFVSNPYLPVAEPVDARYPFHLSTGRLRDQWHGMTRTGTVVQLFAHAPEPALLLSGTDMARRLLKAGDLVHVTSRRGTQIFPVQESNEMRAGQAFVAMHWGEEYVSGRAGSGRAAVGGNGVAGAGVGVGAGANAGANAGAALNAGNDSAIGTDLRSPASRGTHGVNGLTNPAFCPSSKQPELKHAAVKILKAELPWRLVVFGWARPDQALQLQAALRPLMHQFAYASATLFGREQSGVLFRAADDYPADAGLIGQIEALFGIAGSQVLRYDDKKRGHTRRIMQQDGKLAAVLLAGDTAAELWLRQYLDGALPVAELGRMLLMPTAKPPAGFKARGRIVCNCLGVAEAEIVAEIQTQAQAQGQGASPANVLSELQRKLQCGTSCGSCVPELKQMVQVYSSVQREAA
jgi:assimilatory nitrate reductase catalytic subunit